MQPLVAVVMGVLSASFGGVVRDVLAGEPSVLQRKEIYVTAAVAGAGAYVLLRLVGAPEPFAGVVGVLAAFILRAGALVRGWSLPGFATAPALPAPTPLPADVAPPLPPAPEPAPSPEVAATPKPRTRRPRSAPPKAVVAETAAETPKRPRRPRKPVEPA